jgi:hypothetical protein
MCPPTSSYHGLRNPLVGVAGLTAGLLGLALALATYTTLRPSLDPVALLTPPSPAILVIAYDLAGEAKSRYNTVGDGTTSIHTTPHSSDVPRRGGGCEEPSILDNTRICNNNNTPITSTYNEEDKVAHSHDKSL